MSSIKKAFGPKFLVKIEFEMDSALAIMQRDKNLSRFTKEEQQFTIYRDSFRKICDESQTFGPILQRILNQFERKISDLTRDLAYNRDGRLKALTELQELQKSIAEQMDLSDSGDSRRKSGDSGISKPKSALEQLRARTRLVHSQTRQDRLEKELRQETALVAQLQRRERELLEKVKEDDDAKTLMYNEYAQLQKAFDQYKDAQKGREDPEVLRMALDQCRRDLSIAHEINNKYRCDYDCVVPQTQFDNLDRQFNLLSDENEELSRNVATLRSERQEMLSLIKEMTQELEEKRFNEEELKRNVAMKEGVKRWQKEVMNE